MIRWIIAILGLLILIVGIWQIASASMWIGITRDILNPTFVRWAGGFAVLIGVLFVIAAIKRLIGLKVFMIIFGLIMTASGLLILVDPQFYKTAIYDILFNHSRSYQISIIRISGLIRAIIGSLILYAASRPPREHYSHWIR